MRELKSLYANYESQEVKDNLYIYESMKFNGKTVFDVVKNGETIHQSNSMQGAENFIKDYTGEK